MAQSETTDQRITDQSRRVVEAALEALNKGDPEAFLSHYSEDVEYWMNGTHKFSGEKKGLAAFQDVVTRVAADLDKMITLELLNFFAVGEWVFCETKGDAYFPDGRPYRNRYAMVWRVRDGKIIEFREYNDSQLIVDSFPNP